jgi:hypothetical protein
MNVETGERGRAVSFLEIHISDLVCSVLRNNCDIFFSAAGAMAGVTAG